MIEWEVIVLNNSSSSLFLIFISVLILNMLLIFFGLYSSFFDVTDTTLIAGIIAFFGAVIGGYITLLGVRKTIDHNNKIEKYKIFIAQHQAIVATIRLFAKAQGRMWEMWSLTHEPYKECNAMFREELNRSSGILDTATLASERVYQSLYNFNEFIDIEYGFYLTDEKMPEDTELYERLGTLTGNCMKILEEERKRLRQEIATTHPN